MKIKLESTTKIVDLVTDGGAVVPARVWEGYTEGGIPVHCYITRVAVRADKDQSQFQTELTETPPALPSPQVAALDARLIL